MAIDPINSSCKTLFKEGTIIDIAADSIQVTIDWEYAVGDYWCDWYYDCGNRIPASPNEAYSVGDKVIVEADPDMFPRRVVGLSEGATPCYSTAIAEVVGSSIRVMIDDVNRWISWKYYAESAYHPNDPDDFSVSCIQFAPDWPFRVGIIAKAEGDGYVVPHNADHILMTWTLDTETYNPVFDGYVKFSVGDIIGFDITEKVRGADGTYGDTNQSNDCYNSGYSNICNSSVYCPIATSTGGENHFHSCLGTVTATGSGHENMALTDSVCCSSYLESMEYNTQFYLPRLGDPTIFTGGTRRGNAMGCGFYDYDYTYLYTTSWGQDPNAIGECSEYVDGYTCIERLHYWEDVSTTDLDCPVNGVFDEGGEYSTTWGGPVGFAFCEEEVNDWSWSDSGSGAGYCKSDERPLGSAIWKILATDAAGDWGDPLYEMDLEYNWMDGCDVNACDGDWCSGECCAGTVTDSCTPGNRYNEYERATQLGRVVGYDKLFYNYPIERYSNTYGDEVFDKKVWNQPLGHSVYIDVDDEHIPDLPVAHIMQSDSTAVSENSLILFSATRLGPYDYNNLRSWSPILNGDGTNWEADLPGTIRDAREITLQSGLEAPLDNPSVCGLLIDADGYGFVRLTNRIMFYDTFVVTNPFSDPVEVAPTGEPVLDMSWYWWTAMERHTAYCIYRQ